MKRRLHNIQGFAYRAGWLLGLSALAFLGFCSINSHHLWYDDEGYVMIGLKGVIAGEPLYTSVYSQYGPFFYQGRELLHRVLEIPLNHNWNRLLTLLGWLLSAGLFSRLIWVLTATRAAALAAFGISFLLLEVVVKEPGHPQQICFILAASVVLLARRHAHPLGWVGIGALNAGLALCKINLGAYLFLALALSVCASHENPRFRRYGGAAVYGLLVLTVIFVTDPGGHVSNFYLAVAVLLSAAAVMGTSRTGIEMRSPFRFNPGWREMGWFAAGAGAVAGISLGVALARGSAPADILWAILLQHAKVAFRPAAPYPAAGPALAAIGALCAVWVRFYRPCRSRDAYGALRAVFALTVLAIVGLGLLADSHKMLTSGAHVRGNAMLLWAVLPGFVWLANVPRGSFQRSVLASLAAVSILAPYPVAGSQVAYAVIFGVGSALLVGSDLWQEKGANDSGPGMRALAFGAVLISAILLTAAAARVYYAQRQYFQRSVPLALPGSTLLHMPVKERDRLHDIVAALNRDCECFVSLNGVNSLYFWTGQIPPTWFNLTVWPYYLTAAHQRAMIRSLNRSNRPCILYHRGFRYLESPHLKTPRGVFGRYVLEEYRPFREWGPWVLLRKSPPGSLRNDSDKSG